MRINTLKLNRYRNYNRLEFEPSPGMNVITGLNGAGKTNVLESVFLCAVGRSHRTARDADLIMHGAEGCSVALSLENRFGGRTIRVKLPAGEHKTLFIDEAKCARSGELMGVLNAVMFAPEDLRIVKDAPAERRRFVDMEISQLRPAYYYALQRYNQALRQKNALLKTGTDRMLMEALDEQLAAAGETIMNGRAEFIERLFKIAANIYGEIAGNAETLSVRYLPNAAAEGNFTRDALMDAFLRASIEDARRGFATAGPHRDDVGIALTGRDARTFGSQGQQRTAALALRLSEIELFEKENGEPPVLLLDDVLSELDDVRQELLLTRIGGCQTILTAASLQNLERAKLPGIRVYGCTSTENGAALRAL